MIDPLVVEIFAKNGIALVETPQCDFVWTHDIYLKSEPPVKDLEIRIRIGNYMGDVVHRETHKNVHHDGASTLANKVLTKFRESILTT